MRHAIGEVVPCLGLADCLGQHASAYHQQRRHGHLRCKPAAQMLRDVWHVQKAAPEFHDTQVHFPIVQALQQKPAVSTFCRSGAASVK